MARWLEAAIDYIPRWLEFQIRATERPERLKLRRVARHAGRLQAFSFAFEVEGEFLAQIGFASIAEEDGSQTASEHVPVAHGQVFCSTRLTPAERRSHFATSAPSCLRPAFVSA